MRRIKELDILTALSAARESKHIEFKEAFDPGQTSDWCEIIKDIVAIANSGGGYVLFGVRKDGSPSGWDRSALCAVDPAQVTDKIAKYTGEQFSEFEIKEAERAGHPIALMKIEAVRVPLIFVQPGTYQVDAGKQKTAFGKGTLYFRHGAKSEPGNSQDLRQFTERELESIRKSWLGNIKKVVTAPRGHHVMVLPREVVESDLPEATRIRLVDDASAPAYRKIDPDVTHPHRQKELVQAINKLMGAARKVSSYDIQCVRRAHKIESVPAFFHAPKFGSPQYSQSFAEWIVRQYALNPAFFDEAWAAARKK